MNTLLEPPPIQSETTPRFDDEHSLWLQFLPIPGLPRPAYWIDSLAGTLLLLDVLQLQLPADGIVLGECLAAGILTDSIFSLPLSEPIRAAQLIITILEKYSLAEFAVMHCLDKTSAELVPCLPAPYDVNNQPMSLDQMKARTRKLMATGQAELANALQTVRAAMLAHRLRISRNDRN